MRFRKRVKIFPGFSLNFSTSGVSATIGPKGANFNVGKQGTFFNTGIPETGFYGRYRIGGDGTTPPKVKHVEVTPPKLEDIELIAPGTSDYNSILEGEIKSAEIDQMTSTTLVELKDQLEQAYKERRSLPLEIEFATQKLKRAKRNLWLWRLTIVGIWFDGPVDRVNEHEEEIDFLRQSLLEAYLDIDIHFDKVIESKYERLRNSFHEISVCEKIWDVTSEIEIDKVKTRSAASIGITRTLTKFGLNNIDIIKSTFQAFHLENRNGGDLYIYPGFVIIIDEKRQFSLIDLKELDVVCYGQKFLETEVVPEETETVDKTWAKVNKDGSRDKRFVGNSEIPIVLYGQLNFKSNSGLNETYMFSNFKKSEEFELAFKELPRHSLRFCFSH